MARKTNNDSWFHGANCPSRGRQTVTPAMADEWLKANRSNRRVQSKSVKRIRDAIVSGRWKYNGQPVIFSKSWRLLDGQHRLLAVVASGIAVEMMVETGVDDEAMVTIDTGGAGSRSAPHAWMIANNVQPTNWTIARVSMCWSGLVGREITTAEDFGAAYEKFHHCVQKVEPIFAAHRIAFSRAPYVAAFAVASAEDFDAVEKLAQQFITGEMLPAKHPMLALRGWVTSKLNLSSAGGGSLVRVAEFRKALSLIADGIDGRERSIARGSGSDAVLARFRKLFQIDE